MGTGGEGEGGLTHTNRGANKRERGAGRGGADRGARQERGAPYVNKGAAQARVGGVGCSCLRATPSHLFFFPSLSLPIPAVGSMVYIFVY